MNTISNMEELKGLEPINIKDNDIKKAEHNLKVTLNRLSKACEQAGIPFFATFYSHDNGYQYRGVLPEEVGVKSEYNRFLKFLQVCVDFNLEDEKPVIKTRKQ